MGKCNALKAFTRKEQCSLLRNKFPNCRQASFTQWGSVRASGTWLQIAVLCVEQGALTAAGEGRILKNSSQRRWRVQVPCVKQIHIQRQFQIRKSWCIVSLKDSKFVSQRRRPGSITSSKVRVREAPRKREQERTNGPTVCPPLLSSYSCASKANMRCATHALSVLRVRISRADGIEIRRQLGAHFLQLTIWKIASGAVHAKRSKWRGDKRQAWENNAAPCCLQLHLRSPNLVDRLRL